MCVCVFNSIDSDFEVHKAVSYMRILKVPLIDFFTALCLLASQRTAL